MLLKRKSNIDKFRSGNQKAFKKLYDIHIDSLIRFGLTYISDKESVKDIVQDSFIKIWNKRSEFKTEESFKSYLYINIKNACLNQLKHEKVKDKYNIHQNHFSDKKEQFQDKIVQEEILLSINSIISELPKAAREVYLRSLEGLKNQEIAEDLDISINTVKSQKKRSAEIVKNKVLKFIS
jgi:RNA polymerase sigma-70 factor (ECF subfamily)